MISPCIKQCKLVDGVCNGCHRSLDQIKNWSNYSMTDKMDIMKKLKGNKSHCPECGVDNKCAIEQGNSASTCWCMLETTNKLSSYYDSCLCRVCLKKEQ